MIGWPVAHSLSPAIHNAAFEALGMDWAYVPLPVPPGALADALAGLPALGFAGANVTMPHKTEAAGLVKELSQDAHRLQAVNAISVTAAGTTGHNTDVSGFERFLERDAGFDPAGRSALIFGAGGAARACALALARGGVVRLAAAVRDQSRAAGLRRTLEGFQTELSVIPLDGAPTVTADVVVNATPLGARGEELPMPRLYPQMTVVDLLYVPGVTPLLSAAREAGAMAFGGLGLLLHQAALSFELWTGMAPPMSAMSAAALADLADRPADPPGDSGLPTLPPPPTPMP